MLEELEVPEVLEVLEVLKARKAHAPQTRGQDPNAIWSFICYINLDKVTNFNWLIRNYV